MYLKNQSESGGEEGNEVGMKKEVAKNEIIDRCTLCGKVLKTNPEEACEGDECEGEYEFNNHSTPTFNFCSECRNMLEQKDKEHNAWGNKWKYQSGTYKSGEL